MAVYFIRPVGMKGPVKIGSSGAPVARLKALAAWSPFPLEIAAYIKGGDQTLERRIHGLFEKNHSHKEWFKESPDLTALIDRLAAGERIESLIDMNAKPADFRVRRISKERRVYLSYSCRIWHAVKRLRESRNDGAHFEPRDVSAIIDRWSGRRRPKPITPTESEMARLDAFLADPGAHAITWERAFPEHATSAHHAAQVPA